MDLDIPIWKVLAVIILIEIAFFTGTMLRKKKAGEKEVKYIQGNKSPGKQIYLQECPKLPEEAKSVKVNGIGIHSDDETGEVIDFTVTMADGSGEVFVEVSENTYGSSFQRSLENVKTAVEKLSGKTLNQTLIGIDSISPGTMKGASGSLAIGVGLYALTEEKTIKPDKAITGVVHGDGGVSPVALLEEKIDTARENEKIDEVLIPGGQCKEFKYTTGVKVTCVNTLQEAVEVAVEQ